MQLNNRDNSMRDAKIDITFLTSTRNPFEALCGLYKGLGGKTELDDKKYDSEQVWAILERLAGRLEEDLRSEESVPGMFASRKSSTSTVSDESDDSGQSARSSNSEGEHGGLDEVGQPVAKSNDMGLSKPEEENVNLSESDSDDLFLDKKLREAQAFARDDPETGRESEADDIDFLADLGSEEGADVKYEDFFDPRPSLGGNFERTKDRAIGKNAKGNDVGDSKQEDHEIEAHADELEKMMQDENPDMEELGRKLLDPGVLDSSSEEEASPGSRSSDELDEDDTALSTFQLKQRRLKERIKDLEQESLKPKPWQLSGEVSASARPQDSLLAENIDFDPGKRPPPEENVEKSQAINEIIKGRIVARVFDDVQRKVPLRARFRPEAAPSLQQTKSEKSLSAIYEEEYTKNLSVGQDSKMVSEVKEQHRELKEQWSRLCIRLDALCSFRPMPTEKLEEASVTQLSERADNTIQREEIAPGAVNSAGATVVPTQLHTRKDKDLKSQEERTSAERARRRQRKKAAIKERHARAAASTSHIESAKGPRRSQKLDEAARGAAYRKLLRQSGVDVKLVDDIGKEMAAKAGGKRSVQGELDRQQKRQKSGRCLDVRLAG